MKDLDIARVPTSVYTHQVNIKVDPETKRRIELLKREKRVDTATEMRKAIAAWLSRVEKIA